MHYSKGRPHSSLGPGIPDFAAVAINPVTLRYQIPRNHRVVSKPILGGLHREYRITTIAA
jgi:hypothetical protein